MSDDRSALIKTAREALAALNVEEQKTLFAECGLLEHYGFVKHMTSPAAQLGALLGGVLGGALSKSEPLCQRHSRARCLECHSTSLGVRYGQRK